MTPIVEVINLKKRYPNAQSVAVADISFSIKQGEVLALLGTNGAGKTSTIKMLLGLIKPTSGLATVCGCDMSLLRSRREVLRQVGAVLEGARNTYWRLSGKENLLYFAGVKGVARKSAQKRAKELLDLFDLTDAADKEVRSYSRGMQQKLAIAAALLTDPDVLLLDEPTLGLDVQSAKLLEQIIIRLAEEGKAILLTTHSMSLAERLATDIFVMFDGKQVAYAPKHELMRDFGRNSIVEIKLTNKLTRSHFEQLQSQFPILSLANSIDTATVRWENPAQADLLALLNQLEQLGFHIHSVNRREASLEEVFLHLVQPNA